jgi:Protein of unknown function (DUF3572)
LRPRETIADDPAAVALQVLVWVLGDELRRERLLALTGLTGEDIRARLGEPALLDAVMGFVEGHQPDLLACADALGLTPERLIAARERLMA